LAGNDDDEKNEDEEDKKPAPIDYGKLTKAEREAALLQNAKEMMALIDKESREITGEKPRTPRLPRVAKVPVPEDTTGTDNEDDKEVGDYKRNEEEGNNDDEVDDDEDKKPAARTSPRK